MGNSPNVKPKFSIRVLLVLFFVVSIVLVFHEFAFEILLFRGYWFSATSFFALGVFVGYKYFPRFFSIAITLFVPAIVVFAYALGARQLVVDPENQGLVSQLPAIETIINELVNFFRRFHGENNKLSNDLGLVLHSTFCLVGALGILSSAVIGWLLGLLFPRKRRITM